jgi:hypothetical protein
MLALVFAGLLAVALAPRRWWVFGTGFVTASALAVNWSALNLPYLDAGDERVSVGALASLPVRIVLAAVAAASIAAMLAQVRVAAPQVRGRSIAVLLLLVVVVATAAVPSTRSIATAGWDRFRAEPGHEAAPRSRFLSLSNDGRIVMWSTAVRAFEGHPVIGVGAGNWRSWYYRYRTRDVGFARQPHALGLELLAERGVVGTGLLAAVFALALASVRRRRGESRDADEQATIVAAAVLVVGWLVHANLDWLWQLPAVTIGPMLAVGVLLAARSPAELALERRPSRRLLPALGASACVVAAIACTIPALAARELTHAASSSRPADAASRLAQLDRLYPFSPDVAHARARVALRLGDQVQARRLEHRSIEREPRFYARWELGSATCDDARDAACSRAWSARARQLDPRRRASGEDEPSREFDA